MQKNTIDMTNGRPVKLMLQFAIPMMIGSIFQSLYSMTDTIIVGRFVGSDALAAIGAASSTVALLMMVTNGVTSAISIVLAQFFGAHNEKGVKAGVAAAGHMTIVLGLVMGLISLILAGPLMKLLNTPSNIIADSTIYIKLVCGLCFAQMAYNSAAGILRSVGDSKTPLYFLIICSVLNIILDLIAVIILDMGVAGVAIATVCSQAISAVLCIFYMFKKFPALRPEKKDLLPNWPVLGKLMSLGGQMALQSTLLSVGMMVITRVINGFGSDVVAAFTVGSNVMNLATMVFSNFSFGFSVYVGQNYGARRPDRIRQGVKEIAILVGCLALSTTLLSQIFARALVTLYVSPTDASVYEAALQFVRVQSCFYPFLAWIWLTNSSLKGMGEIMWTTVSSIVELTCKIGLSLLLPLFLGYTGIWLSAPMGWILGIIPGLVFYLSGKWIKKMEDKPLKA